MYLAMNLLESVSEKNFQCLLSFQEWSCHALCFPKLCYGWIMTDTRGADTGCAGAGRQGVLSACIWAESKHTPDTVPVAGVLATCHILFVCSHGIPNWDFY